MTYISIGGNVIHPVLTALFCAALAVVFAAIEIESEGKYGWAEHMPTWYRTKGFAARVYGFFMQKKPLTGYHAWMFFLPILMFHFPFFFGTEWNWQMEIRTWILYFAWTPLWDYYWFVLNPHYGAGRFNQQTVWWHAKSSWIPTIGLPADYLYAWIVALIVGFVAGDVEWTKMTLFTFLAATIVLILVSPLYHRFYLHMRLRDDRSDAGMFHVVQETERRPSRRTANDPF